MRPIDDSMRSGVRWVPATSAGTTVSGVATGGPLLPTIKRTTAMVELGKKAPDFKLPTDGGGSIALKNLRGRKVVLYFYPKDDTPCCTTEACGFRDAVPDFHTVDAATIGIPRHRTARPA